jgi:hypothetical protein
VFRPRGHRATAETAAEGFCVISLIRDIARQYRIGAGNVVIEWDQDIVASRLPHGLDRRTAAH